MTIGDLIMAWDGQAVLTRYDAETGCWMFIALHDDTLGLPTGGTRFRVYDEPVDGLRDAMRLAEGMTYKWAAIDFPCGGGKGVIAAPGEVPADLRPGLFRRYGKFVESLRGGFATGRDLGTTDADMQALALETAHVHGLDDPDNPRDPGPYTARGVHAALRAVWRALGGGETLEGCRVVIQGVGAVGRPLARRLAPEGVRLILSDIDERCAAELAAELGATTVPAADALRTDCDLLAPCAAGGILDAPTVAGLRCRGIAGSANNQLDTEADAERLHARGILYAPDYIANGAGALAFGSIARGETDEDELGRRIDSIEQNLDGLFRKAAKTGESPLAVAQRAVREKLQRARA